MTCATLRETYTYCMNQNDYTSFKECEFIYKLLKKHKCVK